MRRKIIAFFSILLIALALIFSPAVMAEEEQVRVEVKKVARNPFEPSAELRHRFAESVITDWPKIKVLDVMGTGDTIMAAVDMPPIGGMVLKPNMRVSIPISGGRKISFSVKDILTTGVVIRLENGEELRYKYE
ncbi:MAG: hypothetical protein JRJ79_09165 [Deltaproteobacteria bacterium]|nr:hypothetical protein [Deltaproteobacteria bacterium]MBW1795228.1 hypothetical protein [Deltaproteobacteria bacterium]